MPREFQGKIELDVRDSKADWGAFTATPAPEGAPNVLVIIIDVERHFAAAMARD